MAWHLLEKVIEHSAAHSTIFGKWWIAFVFVFRMIVVASIGDTVYSDEQDEFVCNTKQPGCKQVCYNLFAPISHIRFWGFQIIATGTPPMVFIIFAMHVLSSLPKVEKKNQITRKCSVCSLSSTTTDSNKSNSSRRSKQSSAFHLCQNMDVFSSNCTIFNSTSSPSRKKIFQEQKIKRAKTIVLLGYILNVMARTAIEGVCLFLQYYLYKWTVPEFYECIRYPCPKIVECYVSRPMEKTIFLYFMFGVGVVCLSINILELKYLGWLRIKRAWKRRKETEIASSNIPAFRVATNDGCQNMKAQNHKKVIQYFPHPLISGCYISDLNLSSKKHRSSSSRSPYVWRQSSTFLTPHSDVTCDV